MFVARCFIRPDKWSEGAMKLSFWSLNIGLFMMVFVNLIPVGMLQLFDSFKHGYWHSREPYFFAGPAVRFFEWARLPGDIISIVGGILPVVYLPVRMFVERRRYRDLAAEERTEESVQVYEQCRHQEVFRHHGRGTGFLV